jgi:FdrA protein
MALRGAVRRSFYQDSMVLMRIAGELRGRPGVREAACLMGTPANHQLLAAAGLEIAPVRDAGGGDLMLVVDAESDAAADAAMEAARGLLDARRRLRENAGRMLPRTLGSAIRQLPDANLATISVPGAYATFEAMAALRRGLHVFLFSDNVSLADEIALKQAAIDRGLLCMGPDCGTAYLNGIGLGFANVVPRGRIGVVSASGTGLQAVASRLASLGEGVSHGIGVGGRDLSAEVGGRMTAFALAALARDPATELIVVISKPPAPAALTRLTGALASTGKPVVVCCLGAPRPPGTDGHWVATLEDAAEAAAALARGRPWVPRAFADVSDVEGRLARIAAGRERGGSLLGLFVGGTLAHEARVVLDGWLGEAAPGVRRRHRLLDLGGDEYTAGRPHPMLDPAARDARVREAGGEPEVGVLLLDLVLGRGTHADPARSLAAAVKDARAVAVRAGRALVVVASVVGTEGDPQGLAGQVAALETAGVHLLPSGAQAARFAALVLDPARAAGLREAGA